MDERQRIKPDKKFVEEVMGRGGDSLKKCYQCSTCTIMCPLSPDNSPFPRKEMIWAQWGLKEKLINDPDIWICQRCGDCSVHCPRDAKPGEVMAALREQVIANCAVPGFLGKAFSSARYLPLLLVIPILLFMAYLWIGGDLHYPNNFIPIHEETELTADVAVGSTVLQVDDVEHFDVGQEIIIKDKNNDETATIASINEEASSITLEESLANTYALEDKAVAGENVIVLDDFIADWHGDIGMFIMFAFVFGVLGLGIRKFWKGLMSSVPETSRTGLTLFQCLVAAVFEIAKHANFTKCESSKKVYYAHLGILYGCIALIGATGITFLLHYLAGMHSPWGILSATKIFAIIGTALVSAGLFLAIYRRLADPDAGKSSLGDWFLLIMLSLAVLSGLATWLIRVSEWEAGTYWVYLIHLVFMFEFFIYLPFSKAAHIFYRLTASTWTYYTGRGL
ncbi:MAG: 4Fe-4S dicluster domain-containing protein [Chloroflexi bacterium]|nr:4Fe-4S dicluster domain-containing protein [Chloroflexota bacterium]